MSFLDHQAEEITPRLMRSYPLQGDGKMSDKYRELKEDLRESERRISSDIREREQRFEESLKRFYQDGREREERFYKLTEEIKHNNQILREDVRHEVSLIKKDLNIIREDLNVAKQEISNFTKHNESLATTNKWSNVATIIGISAIVITAIGAIISVVVLS